MDDELKQVSACFPLDFPEFDYGNPKSPWKQKIKPYALPKDILTREDSKYPRLIKVLLAMCKNPTFQNHLRGSYDKFFENAVTSSDPAGVYGDDYAERCVAWLKDALKKAPASGSTVRNTGAQFFLCSQLELFAKPVPVLSSSALFEGATRSVKINSDVRLKSLMSALDKLPKKLEGTKSEGGAHIIKSLWLARCLRETLKNCGQYSSKRGARAFMGHHSPVDDWGEGTVRFLKHISPDQGGVLKFLPHYTRVSELQEEFAGRFCPSYLSMWFCLTRVYRKKHGLTLAFESESVAPKRKSAAPKPKSQAPKKPKYSRVDILEAYFHESMENKRLLREVKALREQNAQKDALIRTLRQD